MSGAFHDMVTEDLQSILAEDTASELVTYTSRASGITRQRYLQVMRGRAALENERDGRGISEAGYAFVSTDFTLGIENPAELDSFVDAHDEKWIVKGVSRVKGGAHLMIERYTQKTRAGDDFYIQR